jgi:hypothetical protein
VGALSRRETSVTQPAACSLRRLRGNPEADESYTSSSGGFSLRYCRKADLLLDFM